jgi:toxin ParE1/3/4
LACIAKGKLSNRKVRKVRQESRGGRSINTNHSGNQLECQRLTLSFDATIILRSARSDIERIYRYWEERVSEEVAERIIERITDRFWLIAEYPSAGRASADIAPGVRCFPAGKYLIYYRPTGQGMVVGQFAGEPNCNHEGHKGTRRNTFAIKDLR